MDTITHGIVGALIGKAYFAPEPPKKAKEAPPSWRKPPHDARRVAIIAATLGAIFPDIDVFAGPLAHNSLAMIMWHRSITHSIVMLPLWAALLAALTAALARPLRWPAPPWKTLFTIYAVALASHIFLDVITSFGTMVWSPINSARPAWDWLFIVDLTLTGAALVPQLGAWAFRKSEGVGRRAFVTWASAAGCVFVVALVVRRIGIPFSNAGVAAAAVMLAGFLILPLRRGAGVRFGRTRWARAGVALTAGYIAFAGGMHHVALQKVNAFVAEARLNAQSTAALPLPPSAAGWAGMVATPDGIYRVEFDQFGSGPVQFHFFPQAASNSYTATARNLRDVQIFLAFARFPQFRYFERDGQPVVRITDLRFYGMLGPVLGAAEENPPFTYEVVFTQDGRVVSQGLLRD